ncbi:MAG: hydroxymethylpyrimidine/phosphomethylpyrimidine kinase [Roseibacillus sp.]
MPGPTTEHPVALTIAGFDTCAGAGLQADLLTFHNHGYHCLTACTSLVVETPHQVREVKAISADLLLQQIELLLATYSVSAIKVGLLASPDQVMVLGEILGGQRVPIVVDPVGTSTTGSKLQEPGTSQALIEQLAPLSTLLTPNLPEARLLLGGNSDLPADQVASLLARKIETSVLLTGGHNDSGSDVCDLLIHEGQSEPFCAPRIETSDSLHGTGCVLSSAIAAALGKNANFPTAITSARRYLRAAMTHHLSFPHSAPLLALNHHPTGSHDQ